MLCIAADHLPGRGFKPNPKPLEVSGGGFKPNLKPFRVSNGGVLTKRETLSGLRFHPSLPKRVWGLVWPRKQGSRELTARVRKELRSVFIISNRKFQIERLKS